MKRGMGTVGLFAVLLAGMRLASVTPPKPAAVTAAEPTLHASRTVSPQSKGCEAFGNSNDATAAGEMTALVQRFLQGASENASLAPGSVPDSVKFVIVTVPDPLRTHLGMQFDRTLEAVQQALQDEQYTYDSSWLPWKQQTTNYSGYDDQAKQAHDTAQREQCPGLILFRRNVSLRDAADCTMAQRDAAASSEAPYRCGLFAFVVSESPTVGLNQTQWRNALAWIDSYAGKTSSGRTLRILGPTFSGSMPSIVRALMQIDPAAGSFHNALLYSGRIRGCESWHWLNQQLQLSMKLPVRTADFDENDAIQVNRFLRWIYEQGHALSEVAVLSEDETAYGNLPDAHKTTIAGSTVVKGDSREQSNQGPAQNQGQPCETAYPANNRPVHLYYPRDISAVRSAYEEQSIFSTTPAAESTSTPHTVLQVESGPAGEHTATDSIEPFSGQGMALTEEAQLYGIVNTLRTHDIRYVVLRSTNSLDYLFLTRFLHRAYPDAYVITMGSDMLFGREIDSTEFRGVVALTTFPLLPRGQDWTVQQANLPQHAHRIFGSDIMEGVYLAARFLLTDKGPIGPERAPYIHERKPDIPDYDTPFWERSNGDGSSYPATWLSVIGRDGYWPLAVLTKGFGDTSQQSNLAHVQQPDSNRDGKAKSPFSFGLSSTWKFCCLLVLVVLCVHIFASQRGWSSPDLGMFVQFTPLASRRQNTLVVMGWAAVCSLLVLLFLASARIYVWLKVTDQLWVWILGFATFAGCASALFEPKSRDPMHREKQRRSRAMHPSSSQRLRYWRMVTIVIVIVAALVGLQIFVYADSSGITAAYRAVHLTSGISQMMSLLVLLAGFYWWFWQALCGLALLGNGRPILPRCRTLAPGLARISDEMAADIEDTAVPLPKYEGRNRLFYILPLAFLVLLVCVLQRPWVAGFGFDSVVRSLEGRAFNATFHWMLAIALYFLMLDCGQFLMTWLRLKRLLLSLNRLPLRRTFAALQGLSMHSLWAMSGTSSRARYTVFSHQLESLIHLRNELNSFDAREIGTLHLRESIDRACNHGLRFIERRSKGPDLAMVNDSEALGVRRGFSRCTEKIVTHFLLPEWFTERTSLDMAESAQEGKRPENLRLSENPSVRLAEEFVCMVYVGYLQNMLARMRTMVLSITGVFAALALSIAFYPFTPRPLLALSLLVLLLVLGGVVGVVYAGLDRDTTMSHITNTEPGELGANFWIRILSFVGVPALGLIVAQFPEITDFVVSWVQPGLSAIK